MLGMDNVFDSEPPFVAGGFGKRFRRSERRRQGPVLVRRCEEEVLSKLASKIDILIDDCR